MSEPTLEPGSVSLNICTRGPGKSIPVTTVLEKRLLLALGVLAVIGIGLVIGIITLKQSNDRIPNTFNGPWDNKNVCFTTTCVSEAANLLKSMDTKVNPCEDFYSFVCGNWIKNDYLISNRDSQFLEMSKTIMLRVKEILEELVLNENLPPNKQKTADFYRACMDDDHRDEMGATELLSDLQKFGGWPMIDGNWNLRNFDWADLIIQLFRNGYLNNMLFSVKVGVDIKNTSLSLLSIWQPTLGLFKQQLYVSPQAEELLNAYKVVILTLANLLNDDIVPLQSLVEVEEALQVEVKIANIMEDVNLKYPDTFYHIMTLRELQDLAPKIPWRKIFRGLLPPGSTIANDERIMVTSPTYIKGLNNILEDTNPKVLANYMFYRVVFHASKFLSKMYYTLVNKIFESDKSGLPVMWQMCAVATLELLPLPLTASYVKRYTNNRTKEVLGMMIEDLKSSIKDDIENSYWLDEETRRNALLKVQKMKADIGYQEEIMSNDNLDRFYTNVTITDSFFGNVKQLIAFRMREAMKGLHEKRERFRWYEDDDLLTANAYYKPTENIITVPVGVLQDTVFAADRPNYINYGSLGMIVGHELTHAFDSIGSGYDADGNYRNWWSDESWQNFEARMGCYIFQYNKYYVPEANTYVDGAATLAENIADNGGLKAAYYAYKKLLSRIGSERHLPGLSYNEKQMFWISFASVWCKKETNDSIQYSVQHDVHTQPKFRVIGTLSNMEEFSEDFNCNMYTTMNPAAKCFLWK